MWIEKLNQTKQNQTEQDPANSMPIITEQIEVKQTITQRTFVCNMCCQKRQAARTNASMSGDGPNATDTPLDWRVVDIRSPFGTKRDIVLCNECAYKTPVKSIF